MTVARAMPFAKTYTVAEAAHLAGTTPQNARRWLLGYEAPGHRMKPVLGPRPDDGAVSLSFLELVELIVVARYRRGSGRRLSLERLRAAHEFASTRLGIPFPFASKRLTVEGGNIMHAFDQSDAASARIAVDIGGAFALPAEFGETMDLVDFDIADGMAARFYPYGRATPVVIDPEHAAGRPTIEGSNVRIETIVQRWKAGAKIVDLEEDFEVPAAAIEAVLRAA
ncbi:MAG: DUF433 domain-containing protein [Dehalococcoidia bacterium]